MNKIIKKSCCLLVLGVLGACQSAEDASEQAASRLPQEPVSMEGLKDDCFYTREIADWMPLTTSNLMVMNSTRSRGWLIVFGPKVNTLDNSVAIGFEGANRGRVCGRAGERMVIGPGIGRVYSVLDVRRLDKAKVDEFLADVEARKAQSAAAATETATDEQKSE